MFGRKRIEEMDDELSEFDFPEIREIDLKFCPFRPADKEGKTRDCAPRCTFYVGKFPDGDCLLRIAAEKYVVENKEEKN